MILNPKKVLEQDLVYSQFEDYPIIEQKQLQQNGIDVRLYEAYQIIGPARISEESRQLPEYKQLEPDNDGFYFFKAGYAYALEMIEACQIPENAIAKILHRSTLNRSGASLMGSIYDSGYSGLIGGTLRVWNNIYIKLGTRVAQIVYYEAQSAKQYEGQYQKTFTHHEGKQKVESNNE